MLRGQRLIWRNACGTQTMAWLDTPIGGLQLTAQGDALVALDFCTSAAVDSNTSTSALTPVLAEALASLRAYFQQDNTPCKSQQLGPSRPLGEGNQLLAIPLQLVGTDYQRRVWQRLVEIPVGQVASYGQLAQQLDSGPRAVAAACRANPYPLIIPCHRVVSATGLGGYCGASDGAFLEIKHWLLAHERRMCHA